MKAWSQGGQGSRQNPPNKSALTQHYERGRIFREWRAAAVHSSFQRPQVSSADCLFQQRIRGAINERFSANQKRNTARKTDKKHRERKSTKNQRTWFERKIKHQPFVSSLPFKKKVGWMSSSPARDEATDEAADGVPEKEPIDEVFDLSDHCAWPVDELRVTGRSSDPEIMGLSILVTAVTFMASAVNVSTAGGHAIGCHLSTRPSVTS